MAFSKSSSTSHGGAVSAGHLAVASVLLVGILVMGYGYFERNTFALYVGLAVILAGVLNGLVRILRRGVDNDL